jgi:hypothetical protein
MNKTQIPEQQQNPERENWTKKEYLLEKIYDKYKMEIARKDRLESKAIGYYTIVGISFAAFLVVEPFLFSRGYLIKFTFFEILAFLNYLIIATYLLFFIILVINLHKSYMPKIRAEFDPITNWDTLIELQDETFIESLKVELVKIINMHAKNNGRMANRIQFVNNFCLMNMLLIIAIFIILIITYFV